MLRFKLRAAALHRHHLEHNTEVGVLCRDIQENESGLDTAARVGVS